MKPRTVSREDFDEVVKALQGVLQENRRLKKLLSDALKKTQTIALAVEKSGIMVWREFVKDELRT